MKIRLSILFFLFYSVQGFSSELSGNELSYEDFVDKDKQIKCLYGYYAAKTGDHEAAIKIFEDCIERWDSVYAMIWLAQIYESGVSVEQDLEYATSLIKRGAETEDEAGYSSLARYHYGVALYEGKGIEKNKPEGIKWLKRSSEEGVEEAQKYLKQIDES